MHPHMSMKMRKGSFTGTEQNSKTQASEFSGLNSNLQIMEGKFKQNAGCFSQHLCVTFLTKLTGVILRIPFVLFREGEQKKMRGKKSFEEKNRTNPSKTTRHEKNSSNNKFDITSNIQ